MLQLITTAGTIPWGEALVVGCLQTGTSGPVIIMLFIDVSSGKLGLFHAQSLFPNMLMSTCVVCRRKICWVTYMS